MYRQRGGYFLYGCCRSIIMSLEDVYIHEFNYTLYIVCLFVVLV